LEGLIEEVGILTCDKSFSCRSLSLYDRVRVRV